MLGSVAETEDVLQDAFRNLRPPRHEFADTFHAAMLDSTLPGLA